MTREYFKGQFNTPKAADGKLIDVLQPKRGYTRDDLLAASDWGIYQYSSDGAPEVWISRAGEVAAKFNAGLDDWKILEQQWSYQDGHKPSPAEARLMSKEDLIEAYLGQQKYLEVWIRYQKNRPVAHLIHQMVAEYFSEYHEDAVYWDHFNECFRPKPGLQVDHLDKRKDNNFYTNLNYVSSWQNTRMKSWGVEQKQKFFDGLVKIDRDLIRL